MEVFLDLSLPGKLIISQAWLYFQTNFNKVTLHFKKFVFLCENSIRVYLNSRFAVDIVLETQSKQCLHVLIWFELIG